MLKKLLRQLIRLILNIIARVEVKGYEYEPPEGGFLLVANHLGRLDPTLLFYAIDREDVILPVAEKYKHHWFFGPFTLAVGGFFINRYDADLQAIRQILRRLKAGGIFVVAPEGTRSKTEALQEGRQGAAFFAARSGLPVVPVAITGSEDRVVVENLKHLRRSHILIQAGPSFTLPPLKTHGHEQALAAGTEEIMCRIAVLLPEKYRGVYADHPRLKELLANA